MKATGLFAPLMLAVSLALAACAAQPPVPQDNYYRLKVSPPAAPAKMVLNGMVEVERFSADGLTAGRPIVHTDSGAPHEMREYHYHFWTEPPTTMLRDELVDYLRAAGVAEAVVTPDMRLKADYVISGKIRRLERVIGAEPGSVIELQLAVRDSRDDRLLLLKTYLAKENGATESVSESVLALNRGLAEIFTAFTAELVRL